MKSFKLAAKEIYHYTVQYYIVKCLVALSFLSAASQCYSYKTHFQTVPVLLCSCFTGSGNGHHTDNY